MPYTACTKRRSPDHRIAGSPVTKRLILIYFIKNVACIVRISHRDGFSKDLFFFSRRNLFTTFQQGLFAICTSSNNVFFPGGFNYLFAEPEQNRPYYLIEKILIFPETHLVLEHIQIFQEPLFSHRTDINFTMIFRASISSMIFSSNTYYFPGDPYELIWKKKGNYVYA